MLPAIAKLNLYTVYRDRNDVTSFFDPIVTLLGSQTFWMAIAAVGTVVTLFFIYKQIASAKNITAYEFLRKEDDRFRSEDMGADRTNLAKILILNPDKYAEIDQYADYVLDYFEDLGLLLRKKIVPEYFIWTTCCYYVLRYWEITKKYINWVRKEKNDPTYYSEFEYLYKRMLKLEQKNTKKKVEFTQIELQEFLDEELGVQLRAFTLSDLSCVMEIEASSFDEVHAYPESQFESLHNKHPEGFIVAELQEKVVGYVIGYVSNNVGEIDSIAVVPSFRRLRIGKKLVEYILGRFREMGVKTASLEVHTSNKTAICFFERIGFQIVEAIKEYYEDGGDAYLMKMKIT